jgi:putative ABC transport system permease protein
VSPSWRRVPSLGLTLLWREWRSGELGVLLAALIVAVTALTGVGFLVSRIGAAVAAQAGEVLAADLRLGSPQVIAEGALEEARRRGLATARSLSTLSVVFSGEHSQLTDLHAVSRGYPLRGQLLVAGEAFAPGSVTQQIPPRGEAWPDSRLLTTLGARPGGLLSIGNATFKIGQVLIARPDQDSTFASLTPTLLLNDADLPSTGLIQPGSRVSYAALFAGDRAAIDGFKS